MKYVISVNWEFDSLVDATEQVKHLFSYDPDQCPENVSIYVLKEDEDD